MLWLKRPATSREFLLYWNSPVRGVLDPSADFHRGGYLADSVDVSPSPHVNVVLLACLVPFSEGLDHYRFQSLVNLLRAPVEMLEILDPFEITCADPSRIRKYVRNQRHISLEKNLISLRCSRTIGAFGHELRVDLGRVLFCDNVFKGGWNKYVYVKLQ